MAMTSALRVGSEKPASAAYPAATRDARDRSEAYRRHAGDDPWSREAADREPEPGGKSDVQARDREEMGGAGSGAGSRAGSAVIRVADPHHEGLDEGAPPGRSPGAREAAGRARGGSAPGRAGAGGGQPPDPGVAGAHVSLARVTVPEQPGLVVEPARVAKPPRGAKADHEPPGLAGRQYRRIRMPARVPREPNSMRAGSESAVGREVEPDSAGRHGRDRSDPPRQDEVFAIERRRQARGDCVVGVQRRPEEPGHEPAGRRGTRRQGDEQRGRKQGRRPEPGEAFEPVQRADAEKKGDRARAHVRLPESRPRQPVARAAGRLVRAARRDDPAGSPAPPIVAGSFPSDNRPLSEGSDRSRCRGASSTDGSPSRERSGTSTGSASSGVFSTIATCGGSIAGPPPERPQSGSSVRWCRCLSRW